MSGKTLALVTLFYYIMLGNQATVLKIMMVTLSWGRALVNDQPKPMVLRGAQS